MRIVIDTNVIISGFISPTGTPARIIDLWVEGNLQVILSSAIMEEYSIVFRYPQTQRYHRMSSEEITQTLERFRRIAVMIEPTERLQAVLEDATDNKFLECAVAGGATYIISGDKHLLKLQVYQGIPILTPAAFLAQIDRQ